MCLRHHFLGYSRKKSSKFIPVGDSNSMLYSLCFMLSKTEGFNYMNSTSPASPAIKYPHSHLDPME